MKKDRYTFKEQQQLNHQLQNLLEEYIDIIQEENWSSLYQQIDYDPDTFGEMTQALIESGIDPLDSLNYVPENYLCKNWNIISINLPNTIIRIDSSAFEGCENLESITLPKGLRNIEPWVFHSCPSLKSITLPKTLDYLGDGNFDYCDELEIVNFEGSCEDFIALIKDNTEMFKYSYKLDIISCNDGFIDINTILDRNDWE